jgi:hypothetical protein
VARADADTSKQWGPISNFSQVLAHQPAGLAGWMLPNESIRLNNVKSHKSIERTHERFS